MRGTADPRLVDGGVSDEVATPSTLRGQVRAFWASRDVFIQWTWREVRAQYSQTAVGIGWAVLQPLLSMAVLVVVFGLFAGIPSGGAPYPAFYYAAVLPWVFFQTALLQAVPSIQKQMHILSKIYFPREVVPLAVLAARFLDFLLGAILFVVIHRWYALPVTSSLAWLPAVVCVQIIFTVGVVLLLSAVNVFLRDLAIVMPFVAQVWMFVSPVIYDTEPFVPEGWRTLYRLNPMAPILESYRRILVHGLPPDLSDLGTAFASSAALLLLAYLYFKRLEPRMTDVG